MKKAKIIVSVFLLLLVLGFVGSVCAITGSIGNARMILRDVKTGDVIEKSILVKNVNNVPVDIELFASGDLEDSINIVDNNFRLGAGEEKKAQFTIEVKKSGTTETKVNVKFTPIDEGNGVGLSSTIIVIAEKGPGFFEGLFGGDEEPEVVIGEGSDDGGEVGGFSVVKVSLSITSIILLVFVILLIMASQKKKDVAIKLKKSRSKK